LGNDEKQKALELIAGMSAASNDVIDDRTPPSVADADWVKEKLKQSAEMVERMESLRAQLDELPFDQDDARRRLAEERFGEIFGLAPPKNLDPTAFQAAYLIGRGLTYAEAATFLGIRPADLEAMSTKDFRDVVMHWRERSYEEYRSLMIRLVDHLLRTSKEPGLQVKLLREMRALTEEPELRARWEAEMEIRLREVAAKEREADAAVHSAGLLNAAPVGAVEAFDVEVIDAEFESVDGEK